MSAPAKAISPETVLAARKGDTVARLIKETNDKLLQYADAAESFPYVFKYGDVSEGVLDRVADAYEKEGWGVDQDDGTLVFHSDKL